MIEILRDFPSDEPTRKRFISETIGWSVQFGETERGDPDLHHAVGAVLAEGVLFFNLFLIMVALSACSLLEELADVLSNP